MCILFALLIAGLVFFLVKRGRLGPPPWVTQWHAREGHAPGGHAPGGHSPEGEARRILAERFANGDITSEEFLERASALNWTPGVDGAGHNGSKHG